MNNVLEINPKLKLTHKDGGFIIVAKNDYDKYTKLKSAYFTSMGYLEGFTTPTEEEIRDYEGHKAFMEQCQKLINIMEHWDADRPSTANKYRYSSQDIMNVVSTLMYGPQPIVPAKEQKKNGKRKSTASSKKTEAEGVKNPDDKRS